MSRTYNASKAVAIGCLTFCAFTFCQYAGLVIILQWIYGEALVEQWTTAYVDLISIWFLLAVVGTFAAEIAFHQGRYDLLRRLA